MLDVDTLIASLEAAKAFGLITGRSPVTVSSFEDDEFYVVRATEGIAIPPADGVDSASFHIGFF